jgi:hypothetical protein
VEKLAPAPQPVTRAPRHVVVDASNPRSLQAAVAAAHPGDVIEAPKGDYAGPIEMKDSVDLVSLTPGEATITSNTDPPLIARDVHGARVTGFRVSGLLIVDSSIEANELEVTGASGCGVHIEGRSGGVIRASYIHDNAGCAVLMETGATTRLAGNRISGDVQTPPPGGAQ